MVIWRKYEDESDLPKIIKAVGMLDDRSSNQFLVMAKFKNSKDDYEPSMAHIYCHEEGIKFSLSVNGLSGKIVVSHWSELNRPSGRCIIEKPLTLNMTQKVVMVVVDDFKAVNESDKPIFPTDEEVEDVIKQLNNTSLNNKNKK